MNVARLSGSAEPVIRRLFDAGLKRNAADFRLYRNALEYFLPKWHGSAEAVDSFITNAVERAPPEYGLELYARLYSGTGESQFGRRLYVDSMIDWGRMKQGLNLWVKRFPTSWNKNIYAYHACIAGDKSLAKELLADIGDQPEWEIWQPGARSMFDSCTRWAANPAAEPTAPTLRVPAPVKQGTSSGLAINR
jgi:hypothetical protein